LGYAPSRALFLPALRILSRGDGSQVVHCEPVLPELEVDVYGVSGDVCVVGEVAVRSGLGELRRLLKKLELLKSRYPEKLRPKTILVIYTSLALPELVEEAKAKNVWVLKATQDYYKPDFAKTLISS